MEIPKNRLPEVVNQHYREVASSGDIQHGELNMMIRLYILIYGHVPNVISLDADGYYLNPEAEDYDSYNEDDDNEEYIEEDEKKIYTFDNIFIQQTMINIYNLYKDSAYIIRNDEYPIIFCADEKIIFYSNYMHQIYILQTDAELTGDLKEQIVDKKDDSTHRWYSYVTSTNQGFSETSMKVKKQDIDLEMNYNDDLPHEKIMEFLKSNKSGLVLLHGLCGSGKTTYIRHLMYELKGRNFLVLDQSVFNYISDASFISLLLENKNAVIILEDCETMLTDRVSTNNNMLSTLLNLSDGIIGDSFNFKFICTFNAEITKLDKALQRKGRMKVKYEFKELTKEKTLALAKKLGKDIPEDTKPLTLSEIFNYGEDNGAKDEKKKIGFSK